MGKLAGASEAISFIQSVYFDSDGFYIRNRSWRILNALLGDALRIAIKAGMNFDKSDVQTLYSKFNGDFWMGTPDEKWYTLAIQEKNLSFVKAYEANANRKPWMLNGLRVAVNRVFDWQGLRLRVTSFSECGGYIVACAYDENLGAGDWNQYGGLSPVKKVFKITRAEMVVYDKTLKSAKGGGS